VQNKDARLTVLMDTGCFWRRHRFSDRFCSCSKLAKLGSLPYLQHNRGQSNCMTLPCPLHWPVVGLLRPVCRRARNSFKTSLPATSSVSAIRRLAASIGTLLFHLPFLSLCDHVPCGSMFPLRERNPVPKMARRVCPAAYWHLP